MAASASRSGMVKRSACQARSWRASTAGAAQASGITLETKNATPLVAPIAATTERVVHGDRR